MSEPHDVVKLLLKRMESHPEEFKNSGYRWDRILVEVLEHGNEAEVAAIHTSIRNIRLGEAHEDMMDELCNGEANRRKEKEEQEYERNLAKSLLLTKQQMMQQAQQGLQNAYSNAYDVDLDMYRNTTGPIPIANGGTGTLTNTANQIKEMLGAKK
jgi:hypothetical protein